MQGPKNGITSIADEDFTARMLKGHFRKDAMQKKSGIIWMSVQRITRGPTMHAMSGREVQG